LIKYEEIIKFYQQGFQLSMK